MILQFVIIVLTDFSFSFVDCVLINDGIDICRNNTGIVSYNTNVPVDYDWDLKLNQCSFENGALLLELSKMNFYPSTYCGGSLSISAFDRGRELCEFPKKSCFFIASDGWRMNNSALKDCSDFYWIAHNNIFPLTVKFKKSYDSLYDYGFEMRYLYMPYKEDLHTTQGTTTSQTTSDPQTTEKLIHPRTSAATIKASAITSAVIKPSGYYSLAVGFGVLAGIEAIALVAMFVFRILKNRHEDVGGSISIRMGNQDENVAPVTAQSIDGIYDVVREPIDHAHAPPTDNTSDTSSTNTYAMVEKQDVVNELYTMT